MKMKWMLPVLVLGASALGQTMSATGPATRPAFTIGKDTTLVDGPLKADGTIDYITAINALLGSGVKNEENAAIPLLLIQAGVGEDGSMMPKVRQSLDALHVPIPEKVERMEFLEGYAAHKKGLKTFADQEESQRLAKLEDQLILRPWRAQDQPQAAEWIAASEGMLTEVEQAAKCRRFHVPFVVPSGKSVLGLDGSAIEAAPFLAANVPTHVLISRGLMRQGAGDLEGALADIDVAREVARVVEQGHLNLLHRQDEAIEFNAMRACAGIAASGKLTGGQLVALRKEIERLPVISDDDPVRDKVEEMMALDLVMQCIAGKSLQVMQLQGFDLTRSELDSSDWKSLKWDSMLHETARLAEQRLMGDTYLQRARDLETKQEAVAQWPSPLDEIRSGNERESIFLKRQADESQDNYTSRITRWMMGGNISELKANLGANERARMERVLAVTCVALAEYRLAHGSYPETLGALQPAPEKDGFTGEPLHYRRDGEGFKLWSAGPNQRDDGGTKDDLVVGTE